MTTELKSKRSLPSTIGRPLLRLAGWTVYALLRAVEPLRRVRLGPIRHDRIGHLSSNSEIYLRARAAGVEGPGSTDVLLSDRPINRQLLTMIKRRAIVLELPGADLFFRIALEPLLKGTRFRANLDRHTNAFEAMTWPPQLAFTKAEDARGRAALQAMGIPPDAKLVLIHSRDAAYLAGSQAGRDWAYHDYRDCRIENYLQAATVLAEQGYWVLRMGQSISRPLDLKHPRILDYATRHRSDFMDAWLCGNCTFFLGNTAGLAVVPLAFDRPVGMANLIPIGRLVWHSHDLFIPKLIREKATGRLWSFAEIHSRGAAEWLRGEQYNAAEVETVENTPQEIADLAAEMDARISGTWTPDPADEELQRRWWSLYPEKHSGKSCPARIGAKFLRNHRNLLNIGDSACTR